MTPKYAPSREEGTKPYVVTVRDMGRTSDIVVDAATTAEAKSLAVGRPTAGRYAKSVRRATPADIEED